MYRTMRRRVLLIVVSCLTVMPWCVIGRQATAETADVSASRNTPLDKYVAKKGSVYEWKVIKTQKEDGLTTLIVDMKSQRWRSEDEVDRPVWQHWLVVALPDEVASDIGFLFISGGKNDGNPPGGPSDIVKLMAKATKTVVTELRMVPNQPLIFHNDGKKRYEDDLIAYCWDQFLKTGDPTWLPRFPMAKAAVRAMDTIEALTSSAEGGGKRVDRFVVAGGSKRGWTTWITGAVDTRVVAIVPIVIDVLNVSESMMHHYAAYGFFAPAVWDYVRHGIMTHMKEPRMRELERHVDPFSYLDRLTMPKYVVNAAGDQFFVPDSSQFYFEHLRGEKYLRYVPNAGHSLRGSDAPQSIAAFYWAIVNNRPRPKFTWSFESDDTIRVIAQDPPKEVNLWQAVNPNARDFRIDTLGPAYKKQTLEPNASGQYVAKVEQPTKGYRAYFVELVYDIGAPYDWKVTTPVRVTPDVLPYRDKDPTAVKRSRRKRSRK